VAGIIDRTLSRRKFLAAAGVTLGAAALTLANGECDPAIVRRVVQSQHTLPPHHRMWVWEFTQDGSAEQIAETLAANHLGVVVKTHDGVDWMSKYDDVDGAVAGPHSVEFLAAVFDRAGVPFHAWCVPKGIDPVAEAQMAADVLAAGALSLTLDIEPYDEFWTGTADDAQRFGDELRTRSPYGRVDISIDPRPWMLLQIPMREFVEFADGIQPQIYWDLFNNDDNVTAYTYMGYPPGAGGLTPEFLLETTQQLLSPYDRWLIPVGEGAPLYADAWPRFAHRAWELGMRELSVWRYGTATTAVMQYLAANTAGPEPAFAA
jgi:hypothetical protein